MQRYKVYKVWEERYHGDPKALDIFEVINLLLCKRLNNLKKFLETRNDLGPNS